jgi:hypothetical protein
MGGIRFVRIAMKTNLVPVVRGIIERRILVNFRANADVVARVVPAPFRPKLVRGVGMVGICLIALRHIRPAAIPLPLGLRSENAAHRIAVEWDDPGGPREGVFIPRRDTSSWLQSLAGGRVFPGVHHRSKFDVIENGPSLELRMTARDGMRIHFAGDLAERLPAGSVFDSLEEASEFFRRGSVGYSTSQRRESYDGLELQSQTWEVTPLATRHAQSSFFTTGLGFPEGSLEFDCALLMRNVEHEWHPRRTLSPTQGEKDHECCN